MHTSAKFKGLALCCIYLKEKAVGGATLYAICVMKGFMEEVSPGYGRQGCLY